MARYARLFSTVWSADDDFRALTRDAQWTYMMLISQPDISHCGVLPLTERRWSTLATDTDADSVRAAVAELAAARFVHIDESTEELWVRSYMKHDGQYVSPNGLKAIQRAAAEILSKPLQATVNDAVRSLTEAPPEGDTEAPPPAPPEGDTPPQQPAASSQQPLPAAAAAAEAPDDHGQAAAAALDLYAEYRLSTEPGIRSPRQYRETILREERAIHGQEIADLAAQGRPPRAIVEAIYGISQANIARYTRTVRSVS